MNRSEINTALAKALAYANCGKFDEAQRWGEILIRKLESAGVFRAGSIQVDAGQVRVPIGWREIEAGSEEGGTR